MENPNSNEIGDVRRQSQDFNSLRVYHRERGILFEDPEFPPTALSVTKRPEEIKWLRPSQLCTNPQFIIDNVSKFDVKQGNFNDCWLAATLANLTLHDHLFQQVVPSDNTFADEYYAGIFHFRFWHDGHWTDVVIDDRLPTLSGEPVGIKSSNGREFWSCLFEKAFAKLHGSYDALNSAHVSKAMRNISEGLTLSYRLRRVQPEDLWQLMLSAYEVPSLMAAETWSKPDSGRTDGIENLHAYTITKITILKTPSFNGAERLIRLRNPWGKGEWNGPWSDSSRRWHSIPDSEKERLGFTIEDEGEFWVSFRDFVERFDHLGMSILNPRTIPDESSLAAKRRGKMIAYEGEWRGGVTAGGPAHCQATYPHNPQYIITLDDPDDDGKCPIAVALMQKNRGIMAKKSRSRDALCISFSIYPLSEEGTLPVPLNRDFFVNKWAVEGSPEYSHEREVASYFRLPPGKYCVIPSTKEPNQQGEFLLRVFSGKNVNMLEYDENLRMGDMDTRLVGAKPTAEEQCQDKIVREFFEKVAGKDMEIGCMELKEVLDFVMQQETICTGGFSKETCRSMVAMLDVDRSGKLSFSEFQVLLNDIRAWQRAFKLHDKENTGYLSPFSLREALKSAGYFLNARVLNVLCHHYVDKHGRVAFDDFMTCAVRLKSMMGTFGRNATAEDESAASFKLEEWMEITLYS